jgi:hypothetical protein
MAAAERLEPAHGGLKVAHGESSRSPKRVSGAIAPKGRAAISDVNDPSEMKTTERPQARS